MQIVNPDLDFQKIADEYNENGYVFVREFLEPELAESMHAYLSEHVPWNLYFGEFETTDQLLNESERHKRIGWEELSDMSAEQQATFYPRPRENYVGGFNYAFDRYDSLVAYGRRPNKLDDLFAAVATPAYLALWRGFQGLNRAASLELKASRYMPGQFLSAHADASPPGQVRLAAHVIGLTKNWRETWGGRFTMCKDDGTPIFDRVPSFNTLALFRVPAMHYVTRVEKEATEPRFSLLGWLIMADKRKKLRNRVQRLIRRILQT